MQEKTYKSPLKKLVKFFKTSRDNWKNKYNEKKKELKRAKNQINDLKHRKENWKDRAIKAEGELKELKKALEVDRVVPISTDIEKESIKPKNYSYDLETINTFIKLVLSLSVSMNAASKILNLMFDLKRTPSINSGKLWMLKLGYYNLTKNQTIADDWIYIVDHSIQLGKEKLLLIIAIRAKDLPKDRALKYEDTEIIDLQPVKTSTGKIVYEQVKDVFKKTGVPRAIVSDKGSDINLGIKKLQEEYPDTVHIYDLKHKIALLIKSILESDEEWSEFKKFANYVAKKLQNTSIAGYRPPKQKEKARYMNIEDLVHWGDKILIQYEILQQSQTKTEEQIKLKGVIKDIAKFEESIESWVEMVMVFELIEKFMNIHNLQNDSYEKFYELHGHVLSKIKTAKARGLATQILSFIKEQQGVCNDNERLLHSSQLIESLFGKLKSLEKEQSKSSFTSLILSIGAVVSKRTSAVLKKALETVNVNMINEWSKKKVGTTIQAQRKKLYKLKRVEQNWDSKVNLKSA
jgi:hypothetical protein